MAGKHHCVVCAAVFYCKRSNLLAYKKCNMFVRPKRVSVKRKKHGN